MNRLLFFIAFMVSGGLLWGQSLNLDTCISQAKKHYPNAMDSKVLEQISALQVKSLSTAYLPQLDLTWQASWQNDVPHVASGSMPFTIPMAPKDQYKAMVDIKQLLFDGGAVSAQKKLENAGLEVSLANTDVTLYKVGLSVMESYFTALSVDRQIDILNLVIDDLSARLTEMQARVTNGLVLESDMLLIEVEKTKKEQERSQLLLMLKNAKDVLAIYTATTIGEQSVLTVPEIPASTEQLNRPELNWFSAQNSQLDAAMNATSKQRMPRLLAFGQAGYGNPSYNMLNNEFDTFYMVGLRLNWSITDWGKSHRDKSILSMKKEMVQSGQESFLQSHNLAAVKFSSQIEQQKVALEGDKKIVDLQSRIIATAISQLKNGVITSTDYINRLNGYELAKRLLTNRELEVLKNQNLLAYWRGSAK